MSEAGIPRRIVRPVARLVHSRPLSVILFCAAMISDVSCQNSILTIWYQKYVTTIFKKKPTLHDGPTFF